MENSIQKSFQQFTQSITDALQSTADSLTQNLNNAQSPLTSPEQPTPTQDVNLGKCVCNIDPCMLTIWRDIANIQTALDNHSTDISLLINKAKEDLDILQQRGNYAQYTNECTRHNERVIPNGTDGTATSSSGNISPDTTANTVTSDTTT